MYLSSSSVAWIHRNEESTGSKARHPLYIHLASNANVTSWLIMNQSILK